MNPVVARAAASWLCALAFLAALGNAHAANLFSVIEFVEGHATIVDARGQARPASVGATVLEGETLVTGGDGEIHARTDDHGLIALRPNTRIKVEAYRAAGDDEDRSVLSLARGTLRTITGWIGKYRPSNYAIKTTTATIGIRGTDHEPLVAGPGDAGMAPGTYDKVNEGSTYIQNSIGRTDISAGHAGFSPQDGKTAPRALEKIPAAYRATRNEGRIEARKQELAREMEQRRLERQKETKDRADSGKADESGDAKEKAREREERRRRSRTRP